MLRNVSKTCDFAAEGTLYIRTKTGDLSYMIDRKKRTTLKMIGGAAAVAAIPTIASAGNCFHGDAHKEQHANTETVVPINNGTELTIALSVDPEPTIRMTNHSNQLVIVRHVYPGIIHAGDVAYDLNSIFANSAYAIGAGRSRTVKIQPTSHTQAEADYPRHLYRNKPQRIVAVTGRNERGILANSTRSFFA